MRSNKDDAHPYCFGKLESVFPMGKDGLRSSPESCQPCIYKTECLRTALGTPEGLKVKQEKLDRAYESGMIGFLERWSRKKILRNQRKANSLNAKQRKTKNKGAENDIHKGH